MVLAVGLGVVISVTPAQPPKDKQGDAPKVDKALVDSIVARMMAFDKNKDGQLTKDEITDPRLLRVFERADANKDGVVTREELIALATQMAAEQAQDGGGKGGKGKGGKGKGGPDGFGKGPGGKGLTPFIQEQLNLTEEQKKQLDALQSEVDARLGKILTDEQKQMLKEMKGGPKGGKGPKGPGGPK
jgi:hypothetical protein